MKILIIIFILTIQSASAQSLRLRAREHWDTVTIGESEMPGIGPAFNLWIEKPYDWAVGTVWSTMFVDDNEQVKRTGLELKYWLAGGLFTRFGATNNKYLGQTARGNYFGAGYEFRFEKIGLAFEWSKRSIDFDPVKMEIDSFSIGVHFYGYI